MNVILFQVQPPDACNFLFSTKKSHSKTENCVLACTEKACETQLASWEVQQKHAVFSQRVPGWHHYSSEGIPSDSVHPSNPIYVTEVANALSFWFSKLTFYEGGWSNLAIPPLQTDKVRQSGGYSTVGLSPHVRPLSSACPALHDQSAPPLPTLCSSQANGWTERRKVPRASRSLPVSKSQGQDPRPHDVLPRLVGPSSRAQALASSPLPRAPSPSAASQHHGRLRSGLPLQPRLTHQTVASALPACEPRDQLLSERLPPAVLPWPSCSCCSSFQVQLSLTFPEVHSWAALPIRYVCCT